METVHACKYRTRANSLESSFKEWKQSEDDALLVAPHLLNLPLRNGNSGVSYAKNICFGLLNLPLRNGNRYLFWDSLKRGFSLESSFKEWKHWLTDLGDWESVTLESSFKEWKHARGRALNVGVELLNLPLRNGNTS